MLAWLEHHTDTDVRGSRIRQRFAKPRLPRLAKALVPIVDRLKQAFHIEDVCIVADRGMISGETIAAIEERLRAPADPPQTAITSVQQIVRNVSVNRITPKRLLLHGSVLDRALREARTDSPVRAKTRRLDIASGC